MSSKYATFHAARDLVYALQNPAPTSPLVKLGNGHKGELSNLVEIFRKSIPPALPLRVPVGEAVQENLEEVNQERAQMKIASQSKPVTNEEPLRVPIVEAYPEETQPVNPAKYQSFFLTNQNQEFNSYTKK